MFYVVGVRHTKTRALPPGGQGQAAVFKGRNGAHYLLRKIMLYDSNLLETGNLRADRNIPSEIYF
jgi:hypothetical protein